jgi:hypothetical protein
MVVIGEQRPALIEWVVKQGASVDGKDGDGQPLVFAIGLDCEPCVITLMRLGADPMVSGEGEGQFTISPLEYVRHQGLEKYEDILLAR